MAGLPIPTNDQSLTRTMRIAEGVAVFAGGVILAWLVQYYAGGLLDVDGFYHARMGDLYAKGVIQDAGEHYHWMRHSIFTERFADKDYFWHLFLAPFTMVFGDDPAGLERAGMWGAAVAAGFIALVAVRVYRCHGLIAPALWVALMMTASETFIFRSAMCRSHVLSIAFALLGWHLIATRARLALIILAIFYTLTYTAPHLLLALAGMYWLVEAVSPEGGALQLANPRRYLRPLMPFGCAALGIVIGALLHANSENMIMLWVVQNLAVPLHSYGAHGVANWLGELVGFPVEYVEVTNLGMELNPPDGRELLSSHGIGVLLMIVPWIMASALGVRPTRRDTFAWLCAFMTFAMFLANERFAEYFFPFAALAGGGMISRALISEPVRDARQRSPMATRFAVATVVLLVVVNVVARPVSLHNMISGRERGQYAGLGDAINKHVPKGEAVFHPDWHVFTMLLFYAPEHDYVVGLDPTFLALRSPLHFRAYMGMRSGEEKPGGLSQTYDEIIHGLFDMEWVSVVPANHDAFAKIFQRIELKKHAVLVEADKNDKWRLYKLAPRPDKPASR